MPTIILEDELQELFTDLHESGYFKDGKEISDAELSTKPSIVVEEYRIRKSQPNFDLLKFYQEYFKKAEVLENNYVSDTSKPVTHHIERLWDVLKREPAKTQRYSTLIPLQYSYIVPGGRFNEIYYWDSYFTMLGLQVSRRIDMIENMIENFSWLIQKYGFIPNGNRTYFLGRSQPPFFALMVELLAEEKGNDVWLKYLPILKKEYEFWMDGLENLSNDGIKRVVSYSDGKVLNRYFDNISLPRTEMYSDDVELIEEIGESLALKKILDIRAACESGWDFSARWCTNYFQLDSIHTADILPVDLNCLLYSLENIIAKAEGIVGDMEVKKKFDALAKRRAELINEVFWNKDEKYYFDYDFVKGEQTEVVSAAGLFPLFFNIATEEQARSCADRVEQELLKPGGIVSTTIESGQQWDAPNGWAPLQWIAIEGLRNYGYNELANTIKERWVNLNTKVFKNTGKLMEKYNVVDINLESGGGEYPVQDGFGWTNGVLLKLLSEKEK